MSGLLTSPSFEAHNPRALRYIIDYLPAGDSHSRRIAILNQESATSHFTIYPDAARITHGASSATPGITRSELTTWVSIAHPSVTLRPHAAVMDMVTIRVPRKPTRGEHYGVIWVQQVAHARDARGFAIKEVSGSASGSTWPWAGAASPRPISPLPPSPAIAPPSGQPFLTALAHNTGGLAVDLGGTARLTHGPGGTSAGPFPIHQIITLAPGQAVHVTLSRACGFRRARGKLRQPDQRIHPPYRLGDDPVLAPSGFLAVDPPEHDVLGPLCCHRRAVLLLILIPVRRARQPGRVAM